VPGANTNNGIQLDQNAYSGMDFSYHTNLLLPAIFNPAANYLGLLAGVDTGVSKPIRHRHKLSGDHPPHERRHVLPPAKMISWHSADLERTLAPICNSLAIVRLF